MTAVKLLSSKTPRTMATYLVGYLFYLCLFQSPVLNAASTYCNQTNITLNSESAVNLFQEVYGPCDTIAGDLTIQNVSFMTDLDGLIDIEVVEGTVAINNNDYGSGSNRTNSLTNITGLSRLSRVGGGFELLNNSMLSDCAAVASLLGWPNGEFSSSVGSYVVVGSNAPGCNSVNEIYESRDALRPRYTVTSSAGANGTILPSGSQSILENEKAVFSIEPDAGFDVDFVGGTCGGTLSGDTFTTAPVTENCTVNVAFKNVAQKLFLDLLDTVSVALGQKPPIEREQEPNDTQVDSNEIRFPPVEIRGRLTNEDDVDWFTFFPPLPVSNPTYVEVVFSSAKLLDGTRGFWSVDWWQSGCTSTGQLSGRTIEPPFSYTFFFCNSEPLRVTIKAADSGLFHDTAEYSVQLRLVDNAQGTLDPSSENNAGDSAPSARESVKDTQDLEQAKPIPVLNLFAIFILSGLVGLVGIRRLRTV